MKASAIHINNKLIFRLYNYGLLMKFKLSMTVVFSSVMAYMFCSNTIHYYSVFVIALSGFCITASANIFNQILEKDLDKLMARTADRPLPQQRISIVEAYILAGVIGVIGIAYLSIHFNTLSGVLGAISLMSYAFIYTPMKKLSPVSVFIGAIPGAMPLLIGDTAANDTITMRGVICFAIQFLWQLPHFWSIAWLLNEDYKKAGFYLLPNEGSIKSKSAALQCIPYLFTLVIVATLPYLLNYAGIISFVIVVAMSLYYLYNGYQFAISLSDRDARKLMFTSFAYIPIVLLSLVLDKL